MIISLGYRVKSRVATHFRRWATERLKEYLIKGFAMDDKRLKEMGVEVKSFLKVGIRLSEIAETEPET